MISTYLLDIRTLPDPLADNNGEKNGAIWSMLPRERIEKILRQKQPALRKQNLGAGILLHYAVKEAGGGDTKLQYNAHGKPFIPHFPFNLSHSGDYIILSIMETDRTDTDHTDNFRHGEAPREHLIGCDIERIRTYNPKIAGRFFTKKEYETLENTRGQGPQAELFFQYWTRKESVLKLTGLGMALPMDAFDVSSGMRAVIDRQKAEEWYRSARENEQTGNKRLEMEQAFRILQDRTLYFKEYRCGGYCITVCGTQNDFGPIRSGLPMPGGADSVLDSVTVLPKAEL